MWDSRIRPSIAVPAGFALTLTAAGLMTVLRPYLGPVVDLAVMAALVAVFGWFAGWTSALMTAVFAWLMLDGFAEDRFGVLRWHGGVDVVALGVLAGCGVAACASRTAAVRRRCRASIRRREVELQRLLEESGALRERGG